MHFSHVYDVVHTHTYVDNLEDRREIITQLARFAQIHTQLLKEVLKEKELAY